MTGPRHRGPAPLAGLRIALVNWRDPWHPEAGGAEAYAWEMAQGLHRRGAAVRYLTARADGQAAAEHREGIEIIRLGSRFTVYPRVLGWLLRRRHCFDAVIDCQNGIPFFTPWVMPAGVPVFCVMHHVHDAQFGVHFPPPLAAVGRLLEGRVARRAYREQLCIAVSASTVRAMRERLRWTGPICIIPNGLSPTASAAGTGPADGRNPGGQTITWVGRIVAHKRADRVLDVAARVRTANVTIEVIGQGPCAGQLAAQVAARGLTGTVRLRGHLPDAAKQAEVAASVLHLNTSQGEGWGLCVLEAAQLGVPTVAYDVDGLRDAVRHGETGWLVGAGEAIEDVVERALAELADPARRAQLAAACRRWAARFDWDTSAGMLADLVVAATGRTAGPGGLAGPSAVPETTSGRHQ
jgi:glycosyltransferase involved in cell wall biosynthesis